MHGKFYKVSLELEIKSISCPGVWLCLNGLVSLIVSTLDIEYETKQVQPYFPMIFHDVFYFVKNIERIHGLNGLQKVLEKEKICFLLIQWPVDCPCQGDGVILAKFISPLADLLYPTSLMSNRILNLLMESSSSFPGILSPKIEIVTKVKIVESFKDIKRQNINLQKHVKHMDSNFMEKITKKSQTVCHSKDYHKTRCFHNNDRNKQQSPEHRIIDDSCYSFRRHHSVGNLNYNDKVVQIHQINSCGICSEYYKIFKNINEPRFDTQNRYIDGELTYEISHISNKLEDDLPERLHDKLENIFSDDDRLESDNTKNFLKSHDMSKFPKTCLTSVKQDTDCLVKKFDRLNSNCLCK